MDYTTLSMVGALLGLGGGAFAYRRKERVTLQSKLREVTEENAQLRAELHTTKVKVSPDLLRKYAEMAISAAEQLAAPDDTSKDKLRAALDALRKLDEGDNGVRDWTDAEHRIAIEAVLGERK